MFFKRWMVIVWILEEMGKARRSVCLRFRAFTRMRRFRHLPVLLLHPLYRLCRRLHVLLQVRWHREYPCHLPRSRLCLSILNSRLCLDMLCNRPCRDIPHPPHPHSPHPPHPHSPHPPHLHSPHPPHLHSPHPPHPHSPHNPHSLHKSPSSTTRCP